MGTTGLLLVTAFRHRISEPNIEAGFARFREFAEQDVAYQAFSDAVAACLRDGLILEPIRLPEGALQCHWHLELTPKGVGAAGALIDINRHCATGQSTKLPGSGQASET
jgi:hypothetical protein